MKCKRGQTGALGIVVLAVSILIGLYMISAIFTSVGTSTALPAAVTSAISGANTSANTGMGLMAVAIIVGSAMFILGILGGK